MSEERPRAWLGADPGEWGAIAVVDWPELAAAYPICGLDEVGLLELVDEIRNQYDIQFAFVEQIRPLPAHMRGPIASVKLSASCQNVKTVLAAHRIDFEPVEAVVWQRALGCLNRGGNKAISRARAVRLFPRIKVTHQIADALLIALHCQQQASHPELRFHKPANRRHTRKLWRQP